MVVRTGDSGEPVKDVQRGLNKLGAMLLVDGEYGRSTRDAVAIARQRLGCPGPADEVDDALQAAIAAVPEPFPPLTSAGLTFIARAEVSDAVTYRKKFQTPCAPPRPSGITIGIGYDCAFVTPSELRADWQEALPAGAIDRLVPVCGKEGSEDLRELVKDVVIPLDAAMTVFARRSLVRFVDRTRGIYPQIDALPPARRTALVSLVYNRGTRLTDREPARQERREMRAIRDLLAAGAHDAVAAQFESMTRLWDPARAGGLIRRRREEAKLWQEGFAALQLE